MTYLQVTSKVGHKPFLFEPQESNAQSIVRLQVSNDILILVDTEENPYRKTRKGGIFLY